MNNPNTFDKLKERIEKLKAKIVLEFKGHLESEDLQLLISLIEKEANQAAIENIQKSSELENLRNQMIFLKSQLKNSEEKASELSPIKVVARECISIFRHIVYSERFLNKDLLKKAEAATTLLDLSIQEDKTPRKSLKINRYG